MSTTNSVAKQLLRTGAYKTGDFTLASGKSSKHYIDAKLATSDPIVLRSIVQHAVPYVIGHEAVAGTVLGGVPFAVALGLETGRTTYLVRPEPKEHGTGQRVEGPPRQGAKVLMVEDVVTTGGSLLDAVEATREAGYEVGHAVTIVDRQEGGRELLREHDVALHALTTLSELEAEAQEDDDA